MKSIITLFAVLLSTVTFAQNFAQVGQDSIEYELTGYGEPWIVMVSGAGGDLNAFQEVRDFLSRETTVLCFSRSGSGNSTFNHGDESFDFIIDELRALLDTLNAPDNIILGAHSFGGLIVRAYATKYPEGVRGIVSVDPTFEDYFKSLSKVYPEAKAYETSLYYTDDFQEKPSGSKRDANAMFEVWNNPEKWSAWFNVNSSIPHFVLTSTQILPGNKLRDSEELMQARYEAQRRTVIDSDTHMQISIPDAGHPIQYLKTGITYDTFMMMLNICR